MSENNQIHLLSFIANLIHPKNESEKLNFPKSQIFWDNIVKFGSAHLILPSLYGSLNRKKLTHHAPKDFLLYLKEIYDLNRVRNKEIIKQLVFLSDVFNQNKIQYVFLKGSALIMLDYQNIKNERMLGDIDILISEKDLFRAKNLLTDEGYEPVRNEYSFVENLRTNKHLKRIVHPNFIAAVELHSQLLEDKSINHIKSSNIFKNRQQIGNGYWIPSKNHLWLHAILNWQFNDNGLIYNDISMRSYLDVIYLEPEGFKNNLAFHPAVSHFYSLISLLNLNYHNKNRLSSLICKYKLIYPKFRYFYDLKTKCKIMIKIILSRLELIFKSKIYRKRILKNPNLLIRRIFIFWKKK